jgi:hypothetical protein
MNSDPTQWLELGSLTFHAFEVQSVRSENLLYVFVIVESVYTICAGKNRDVNNMLLRRCLSFGLELHVSDARHLSCVCYQPTVSTRSAHYSLV